MNLKYDYSLLDVDNNGFIEIEEWLTFVRKLDVNFHFSETDLKRMFYSILWQNGWKYWEVDVITEKASCNLLRIGHHKGIYDQIVKFMLTHCAG